MAVGAIHVWPAGSTSAARLPRRAATATGYSWTLDVLRASIEELLAEQKHGGITYTRVVGR